MRRCRAVGRIFDFDFFAAFQHDFVNHRRRGGNQIHVELALKRFLHDFRLADQETAAEANPNASGSNFNEASLSYNFPKHHARLRSRGFHGVETSILGFHLLETRQRLSEEGLATSNRVADFACPNSFTPVIKSPLRRLWFLFLNRFRCKYAYSTCVSALVLIKRTLSFSLMVPFSHGSTLTTLKAAHEKRTTFCLY